MRISKSWKSLSRILATQSSSSCRRPQVGMMTETAGVQPGAGCVSAARRMAIGEASQPIAPDGAFHKAIEPCGGLPTEETAKHHAEGGGAQDQPGPLGECLAEHDARLRVRPGALEVPREQHLREGLTAACGAGQSGALALREVLPPLEHPYALLDRSKRIAPELSGEIVVVVGEEIGQRPAAPIPPADLQVA